MAGARVEAQLQLTTAVMAEQRSTVFLLLGMLVWVAAAFAGALIAAVLMGLGEGLLLGLHGPGSFSVPTDVAYVLVPAWVFQGILLLAALRQGRRAANGDWRTGLGTGPVENKGRVTLLCATMILWLTGFILLTAAIPALRDFVKSVTPDVLSGSGDDGVGMVFLRVGLVAVLAPVSEELFFRGWLWEALRRRGHAPGITACLTATPWLLLHGIDAPGRILVLIPAAVIISLARDYGGGVRASLAVHVTNNGAAVLMQTLAALSGHGT
jgi:uncharacterized protein